MSDATERYDIPVPGQPGNTIEALSSEELAEVVVDGCGERFPKSWTWALACEVTLLREATDRLQSDLRAAIDERDRAVAEVARMRRLASFYRRAAVIGEAMTKTDAEYLADLDAMDGGS